uniref:Uncharacterized protein n=1 Tax=viral metagenome TaxID=1070528 RepID=A0A6C0E2J5_9ZZZZ
MADNITSIQNTLFNAVIFITYALYFLIVFGISTHAPEYLEGLQYWVKIYVSLFLILRFNFLRKVEFTQLDRKIAFTAGLFLLTTTIVEQVMYDYFLKAKKYVNYI